jgi:pimeloyl-ACP methyl ester carboxylesterase
MYTDHLYVPLTGVAPGSALHVERTGYGGPPVVLLHGFGTSSYLWREVAPRLAERGLTVLAIDLLGFGESMSPSERGTSPAEQAAHVELALLALRTAPAVVVGVGLGALVALLLAARAPDRVQRLMLVNPLDPDDLPGPSLRALQRSTVAAALSSHSLFGARPLLEPFLTRAMPEGQHMADVVMARHLAPFVGPDGAARLLQLAGAVTLDEESREGLGKLRREVLLWLGVGAGGTARGRSDAEAGSPVDQIARWRALLPACELRPVVTDTPAGGLVPELAPEALVSAIGAWMP